MSEERINQGFLVSILLHFAVVWLGLFFEGAPQGIGNQPIEIEILDPSSKNKRVFVTDPNPNELQPEYSPEEIKKRADQLSRITRRVKKQQVANRQGPSRNRSGLGRPSRETGRSNSRLKKKAESDLQRSLVPSGRGGLNSQLALGQSAIAESIPGVETGFFTALNSDRFTFYSFFSRTNEQVRYRWVREIRQFAGRMGQNQLRTLSMMPRRTFVSIFLTPEGDFIDAKVLRSSGYEGLDKAALLAFQEAAPFGNPPEEMVNETGQIRLDYQFVVEWNPSQVARRKQ